MAATLLARSEKKGNIIALQLLHGQRRVMFIRNRNNKGGLHPMNESAEYD